jgi:putative ATP-dependent endonuclease of OLD family
MSLLLQQEVIMVHPLADVGLQIADFKGFGEPSGFDSFKPINVIIGRNNSGKSALIDAIELCISQGETFKPLKHSRNGKPFKVRITQSMDESSLRRIFRDNTSGGGIPGNHWAYASPFLGRRITREFSVGWNPSLVGSEFASMQSQAGTALNDLIRTMAWPFFNIQMIRIAAERDIVPEVSTGDRRVEPNGQGSTNLVRAFLLSDDLPRSEVEINLLSDLNSVYEGDSVFENIIVREDVSSKEWEIFLREDNKGDIRLSQSGSSLKSVFILLSMLRLMPVIKNINWDGVVFTLEEPENNLHPALLRRLLRFLADRRDALGFTLVITTHSPVCIDWSARRNDCQILHVKSLNQISVVNTAIGYMSNTHILDDLDVRASDILQANGVVWVEGPSDRIYLKRWLEAISQGQIIEGVHYTTMFYGGKVLSHFDALPPDQSGDLVSLLSLNRNAAILIDSDRRLGGSKTTTGKMRKPRMHINQTKRKIKSELEGIGGFVWVTEGKEIENYIGYEAIKRLSGADAVKVDNYDSIPELPCLARFQGNKISLAHAAMDGFILQDFISNLDLYEQLSELASRIASWNAMELSIIKLDNIPKLE